MTEIIIDYRIRKNDNVKMNHAENGGSLPFIGGRRTVMQGTFPASLILVNWRRTALLKLRECEIMSSIKLSSYN